MPSSFSFPLIRLVATESTNEVALQLARQGAEHGSVVIAREQTQGRGRGANSFASPPGGLYMSLILRPDLAAPMLPFIPLAGGLACAQAIEEQTGLAVALKWPNDLYLHHRKLGGILAQAGPLSPSSALPFVVLGIGINVNTRPETFPEELRSIATSLYAIKPVQYDLDGLLESIHSRLLAMLPALAGDAASMVNAWRQRDYLLGKEITWRDIRGGTLKGCGAGMQVDGSYLLRAPDGTLHAIMAGDVTIGLKGVEQGDHANPNL
ncbi:MAG: biotin--[acetyl-CoA-carboxylase] ligase [Desulfobulbus sp.]|nr:MAG: biotin--[acetyl-CoA-carboxylase] ligase [Desulfobulbus sp.]